MKLFIKEEKMKKVYLAPDRGEITIIPQKL